jgi:triosephosphate isomerase (TIM)
MPERRPIIAANWKMHKTHLEAIQAVQKLSYLVPKEHTEQVDVSVHPPFTDLRSVQTLIDADRLPFILGAQHCHWEDQGAFTGEVSPLFLAKLEVRYVICGHSERRELFGETDEMVAAKVVAVQRHGMTPILCVGETLEEREAGSTEAKVLGQVTAALSGRSRSQIASLVIAYEPIWAIGTGKTPTVEDVRTVHAFIRDQLNKRFGEKVGTSLRILYGGSVKPSNAAELLAVANVDGALVGGASLKASDFIAICKASRPA